MRDPASGVGDGGDDNTHVLTQCCGHQFLLLLRGYGLVLCSVASNQAGAATAMMGHGRSLPVGMQRNDARGEAARFPRARKRECPGGSVIGGDWLRWGPWWACSATPLAVGVGLVRFEERLRQLDGQCLGCLRGFLVCAARRACAVHTRGSRSEHTEEASKRSLTGARRRHRLEGPWRKQHTHTDTMLWQKSFFVASWMSFGIFPVAPNRPRVPPRRWVTGARCLSACGHMTQAGPAACCPRAHQRVCTGGSVVVGDLLGWHPR